MANKAILVQGGDGTAIPAGMVGEKIAFTPRTVTGSGGAWTSNTSALATLTAGVWRVASRAAFSGSGAANTVESKVCTNSATDSTGTVTDLFMVYTANASAANSFSLPMAEWDIVNVSTTQDLFAKCFGEDAAVNVTVAGFAIRIA